MYVYRCGVCICVCIVYMRISAYVRLYLPPPPPPPLLPPAKMHSAVARNGSQPEEAGRTPRNRVDFLSKTLIQHTRRLGRSPREINKRVGCVSRCDNDKVDESAAHARPHTCARARARAPSRAEASSAELSRAEPSRAVLSRVKSNRAEDAHARIRTTATTTDTTDDDDDDDDDDGDDGDRLA
ncbi:hypothetical protein V1478_011561 [Vespula squamosa]|uniref:Uncharacterized protein n=1 Tax=Vespula squamosa TaxID=30214 RepID=A0ABD2AEU6_VESSQ